MQQKLAFERHLEEKQKEHTQLLLMNNSRKENMLSSVRQVRHMLYHTAVRQVQRLALHPIPCMFSSCLGGFPPCSLKTCRLGESATLSFVDFSYISVSALSRVQEQERVEQGVSQQQRAQEAERLLVLEKVRQAEDNISNRISNMLMDNNRQDRRDLTVRCVVCFAVKRLFISVTDQSLLTAVCLFQSLQAEKECRVSPSHGGRSVSRQTTSPEHPDQTRYEAVQHRGSHPVVFH